MRMPKFFRIDPKTGALVAGLALLAKDGASRLLDFMGKIIDFLLSVLAVLGIFIGLFVVFGSIEAPGASGSWPFVLSVAGSFLIGAARAIWIGARRGLGAKVICGLVAGQEDLLKIADRWEMLSDRKPNQALPQGFGGSISIVKRAGYLLLSPGLGARGVLIGLPIVLGSRAWKTGRKISSRSHGGLAAMAANAGKAAGGGAYRAIGKIGDAARARGSEALSRIEKERLEEDVSLPDLGNERKDRIL